MRALRTLAKSCALLLLGSDARPRRILRGLPAGYRICVSPSENLSYLVGTAEPHLQKAIRQYVKSGDVAYDIGANVGYVSLSFAKQVGPNGRVIAMEPIPRNVSLLRKNVEMNNLANITVWDAAASDRSGQTLMRVAGNFSTASMAWHRDDPAAVEFEVRTVAIDELTQTGDLPLPGFVKIDVEGAEGYTLAGMQRTLAVAKPVLFVECSDAGRETAWRLLSDLGYSCFTAVSRQPVTAFDQYRHADFLWLPHPNL